VTVDSVPAGFLSYAHIDDEDGRVTAFRKALEGEVRRQTGRQDVRIFQDLDGLAWGQAWEERIDSSLDAVTFLVPVLTPSFFASKQCRRELQRFLDRERRLGRRGNKGTICLHCPHMMITPERGVSSGPRSVLRRGW
jgi:F-box protein 11